MKIRKARRLSVLAVAATFLAATAGCSAVPQPREETASLPTPSGTSSNEVEEYEATVPVQAVIVVAGVDQDGLGVSASGYVSGVIQSGGLCTFTFTGNGATVPVTSSGISDRMTTSCGIVQIPRDRLQRGSWTVTLTYELMTVSTMSQPMNLEIP